jgi:hypothetical protein
MIHRQRTGGSSGNKYNNSRIISAKIYSFFNGIQGFCTNAMPSLSSDLDGVEVLYECSQSRFDSKKPTFRFRLETVVQGTVICRQRRQRLEPVGLLCCLSVFTSSFIAKERPYVVDQSGGLLHRGEMSTRLHDRPPPQIIIALGRPAWRKGQLARRGWRWPRVLPRTGCGYATAAGDHARLRNNSAQMCYSSGSPNRA